MCLLTVGFTSVWGAESRFVLRVMWGEVRFQRQWHRASQGFGITAVSIPASSESARAFSTGASAGSGLLGSPAAAPGVVCGRARLLTREATPKVHTNLRGRGDSQATLQPFSPGKPKAAVSMLEQQRSRPTLTTPTDPQTNTDWASKKAGSEKQSSRGL